MNNALMFRTSLASAVLAAVLAMGLAAGTGVSRAQAATLVVYCGGSMAEPLKQVGADFTRVTGNTLDITSATTGVMLKRLQAGEKADLIALVDDALGGLGKDGSVIASSIRPVGRVVLGVSVKAGAPRPDISTPEAFKASMLAAKSVAYPDPALGATSGTSVAKLFDGWGISEQMKAKTVLKPVGAQVAKAVADGEVELGLTFVSEMIPEKRIDVVGLFPAAILNPQLYDIGLSTKATDPAVARAFLDFLAQPAEQARLKAAGIELVARPAG